MFQQEQTEPQLCENKQSEPIKIVEVQGKQINKEINCTEYKNTLSENWSNDISELETFFEKIILPMQPVLLNNHSTITNISLFIESHISTIKANNGKIAFLPYLDRLNELKNILLN